MTWLIYKVSCNIVQVQETVSNLVIEPRHEKINVLVSDLVRHKPVQLQKMARGLEFLI